MTISETGGTYSVNNGLTITGGSSYEGIFSTSSINPQTTITDFYGYLTGTANYNSQFGLYGNTSAGEPQYFIWTPVADNYSLLTYDGTIGTKTTITTSGSQTSSSVWSMWASTTYAYASYNYGTAVSNNANFVASTAQYIGIQAKSTSNGAFVQWLRVRAYPPNGVMPSTTFGSVQSTAIILYLNGVSNANATITYGTESNFTAVLAIDYVSIYVNGTKVASLTQGKAVYLKTLAAGLYKITAATNASGVNNQTYYEKINRKASNLSATVNGKALGSYILRDANLSLNGTVSPNILTAKFYDNGKLLGSSPQTILYNFSTLGNNIIVFNTSGNQNYSAASITGTINLTTNQFIIQDIAQNSSEISKFNLTVSNSTTSKSYKNIDYNSTILYSELPQGTDTFNFSNTAYNYSIVSQSNSIFTTTNTTVTAKQWEWIYFNAKVSQTGLALANYTFNLSDTNAFKYTANVSSQAKLSLQKLYSGTATVTIIKTGYNTTIDKISFTSLSPSANTYTITVSEAALFINVYNWLNLQAINNVSSIQISNSTASKVLNNQTVPVSLLASQIVYVFADGESDVKDILSIVVLYPLQRIAAGNRYFQLLEHKI